jgi:hypothetical protein
LSLSVRTSHSSFVRPLKPKKGWMLFSSIWICAITGALVRHFSVDIFYKISNFFYLGTSFGVWGLRVCACKHARCMHTNAHAVIASRSIASPPRNL